jgi:hypothetical protein
MKPLLAVGLGCLAGFVGAAQQAGPALSIDAAAGQHAISPDIYGINFYWDLSTDTDPLHIAAAEIRATARRWGGNESDRYDYRTDYRNKTSDWYFEDLQDTGTPGLQLPEGSSFNQYADQVRTTNGKILATANVLGWLPKAQPACSYSVANYGQQCSTDPWWPSCGDGLHTGSGSSCGSAILTNDPTDANFQVDQSYQQGWISYLLSRYGQGNQGGATIWDLANEPIWWDDTNQDIHPNPYTYDELLSLDMASAIAIKQADPTALVSGPVADNYASIWYSKKDIVSGQAKGAWWANPVDQNAHGGVPIMAWYLQQFQAYETKNNVRLLDYYDTHAYLAPGSDPASLLDSTREWWDPTYIVDGNYWICDPTNNGAPTAPQLIPRLKAIINANYPGTKLAITEYSFGSLDTITGALAQADILGIFGREGADLATLWGPPKPTDPGAFAFRMYRNYDGIGGAFGETGVQAASADQSQLSVYGALRSDLNLTAVVINKTANDLSSTLNLANFSPGAAAHVWLYSGANLGAIVAQPDVATNAGAVTMVFPAYSITLLDFPPASNAGAAAGGGGRDQRGVLRQRDRSRADGGRLGHQHGTCHADHALRARFQWHGEHVDGRRAHSFRWCAGPAVVCFGHPVCRGGALFRSIQLDHARAGGISGRPQRAAGGSHLRDRARHLHHQCQRHRPGLDPQPGLQESTPPTTRRRAVRSSASGPPAKA